ncbi:hypothetical protein [Streptomyces sp. CAU 1734]|uniref:hypothetical protein n=1 Tax=Streptomyces sp. CAU 1734 TaxID=3140360 RepID=UPI00326037C3
MTEPNDPAAAAEEPETATIPELARRAGRSRTLIHRLAANPGQRWPQPVFKPGSSRPRYPVAWFDAYWAARQAGITQGRRTDLDPGPDPDPDPEP